MDDMNQFYFHGFFSEDNYDIPKADLFKHNIYELKEDIESENEKVLYKESNDETLIQKENIEDNISTSSEKKIIDKKELRKLKNKESARKCRMKKKEEFKYILGENEKLKNELCFLRKKLSTHLCTECKQKILNSQNENYQISSKNDFQNTNNKKFFLNKKRSCVIFTAITLFCCFFLNISFPIQKKINLRNLSKSFYSINKYIQNKNTTYSPMIIQNGILIKNGNEEIEGNIFRYKKLIEIDLKNLYQNEEKKNRRDKIYLTNDKLKKIRLCFEFEPFWKEIDKAGESGIGMELINKKMSLFE